MTQLVERSVRICGSERSREEGGIDGKTFIHPRFSPEVSSDGVDRQQVAR